jgi:3-phenylpropionate/trans-cinnamate dioxygenase ferredoxin subunit
MDKNGFVSSIKESDIKEGQMKGIRLKGKAILVVRKGERIYGLSNLCPHMGCSFEGGILNGYLLMCPCHGWKFDIRNGQYEENKETTLITYSCKIENGRVYIKL